MRIGVDVGGTNTDAVLVDGTSVIASCKQTTTSDVSSGIQTAMQRVLDSADVAADTITSVMIGTTHFTNAFVARQSLQKVGILRVALPAASGIPPLVDWPEDLREAIEGPCFQVRGGFQYDGRVNAELDEGGVRDAARRFAAAGIETISISSLFSPINADMELRAAEIVRETMGKDISITLSHTIGRIGLLERENATIMNASLARLSRDVVRSFATAINALKLNAPFYISQNDGTLMSADFVERYPVLTFASGPTNSMRGAARLANHHTAMVADIGGTTTDFGWLQGGFPRESTVSVDVGGVRTNFRMPDIYAMGLGGGSRVVLEGNEVRIGPGSVGYRLTEDALVFGGTMLTTTDIAVAAGYADIGDRGRVDHLDTKLVERCVQRIHDMIAQGVDRMKTSADPVPLILVGGGSVLVNREIPGCSEVIVPDHAGVANAIGASIAQIGGETDRVFFYDECGREAAMDAARAEACERAIAAGAASDSLKVIDLEELPLAYVPGNAVRVKVKVAGDLAPKNPAQHLRGSSTQ
ncbi:MAG: hydantoinase subunit beta [Haliea sp.]|uniref:hydantoinase/oxoprolinase family protein n=1 Tax=Haliea sp. TaxID=1932666 RepID=UPI000C4C7718|nr:hydantoinase/oxoprolinase family protein [Haliea sp.]MBM69134.1 hydantoinase subunit beta [Haliea sp.]